MTDVDVLLVTHDRADYLARSLPRLLESLPASANLWIWRNGSHPGVGEVLEAHLGDPRIAEFHHSVENVALAEPTRWLWTRSQATLLGKVDDDCLMPDGWVETFVRAHEDVADLGVVAAWHFLPEDLLAEAEQYRVQRLAGGHALLRNCWVGGSGYLMKRSAVSVEEFEGVDESFTRYCIHLARRRWLIGWYYPLVLQDHMDDPRSPHTGIRSDADLVARMPLSTQRLSSSVTVDAWRAQIEASAKTVQTASLRPLDHSGGLLGRLARLRRPKIRL